MDGGRCTASRSGAQTKWAEKARRRSIEMRRVLNRTDRHYYRNTLGNCPRHPRRSAAHVWRRLQQPMPTGRMGRALRAGSAQTSVKLLYGWRAGLPRPIPFILPSHYFALPPFHFAHAGMPSGACRWLWGRPPAVGVYWYLWAGAGGRLQADRSQADVGRRVSCG